MVVSNLSNLRLPHNILPRMVVNRLSKGFPISSTYNRSGCYRVAIPRLPAPNLDNAFLICSGRHDDRGLSVGLLEDGSISSEVSIFKSRQYIHDRLLIRALSFASAASALVLAASALSY